MFQFKPETSSQVKFTGCNLVPLEWMLDSYLAKSQLNPPKLHILLTLLSGRLIFPYKYAKY